MSPLLWLALIAAILLLGGAAFWVSSRRAAAPRPADPAVAAMGYGSERWAREATLWRGILRRLEIQARHEQPPSPRLAAELAEARARLAEAERQQRTPP